jgi:hypothetical protein
MGMFDYLDCNLPIPKGQSMEFQTKDTDCEMKHYFIRADGRLIKHEYEFEDTPVKELPCAAKLKTIPADDPLRSFYEVCGCRRARADSKRDVDQCFDGDLHFYETDETTDEWIEYRATFRSGDCREISIRVENGWSKVWPLEAQA